MLAESSENIVTPEKLEFLESHLLNLPQAECPVMHRFGPGIYIREVTIPAGTVAIGHAQKHEHLNIMISGAVAMIAEDGSHHVLRAPLTFVGKPGRKVGYALETCIWQNVYATTETDIDKLEETYLDKSEAWVSKNSENQLLIGDAHADDRKDFLDLICAAGFSEQEVTAQSENQEDQMQMPVGYGEKLVIRKSPIHGKGVFLTYPAYAGEYLAPARLMGMRTPVGRFTNHSAKPNCEFVMNEAGDIYLMAKKDLPGCSGGDQGTEITVDYRQALALSGIYLEGGK